MTIEQPLNLTCTSGTRIAYYRRLSQNRSNFPTLIFLGGFMSDMQGTKATALERFAVEQDISFIRFDYHGHGQSGGLFTEGTIGQWKTNALSVIDQLTQGELILIGSSMGGWVMILAALERKSRIRGLVGVATACDFTSRLITPNLTAQQCQLLEEEGMINLASEYSETPYPITKQLLEEAQNHLVLNQPINLTMPIRLFHGMNDDDVPYDLSLALMKQIKGDDVQLLLKKDSDHRMASECDLEEMKQKLITLLT